VALVGDRTMSMLHEQFMGIAGPTDVLTFPLEMARGPRRNRAVSGEVVIDVAEARRRGKSDGIEPKLELLLYAIHGMLHLSGYDDRTDRTYRAMHSMEDQLLTRLGVGPIFHGSNINSPRRKTGVTATTKKRHPSRGSQRR
jgi:probable rRNA maturation factor